MVKAITLIAAAVLVFSAPASAGCGVGKSYNGTNVGEYYWDSTNHVWVLESAYYSAEADYATQQSGDIDLTSAFGGGGSGGGGGILLNGLDPSTGDDEVSSAEITFSKSGDSGVELNGTKQPVCLDTIVVTAQVPAPIGGGSPGTGGRSHMTILMTIWDTIFGRTATEIPHKKREENVTCHSGGGSQYGSANADVRDYLIRNGSFSLNNNDRVVIGYDDGSEQGWVVRNVLDTQYPLQSAPATGFWNCH